MKFVPEDFDGSICNCGCSSLEMVAERANAKLQAWLDAAPVVSAEIFNENALSFEWNIGIGRKATHTAKLAYIEEIKK